MNGVIWGLLGALLIGASDCIARVTSQRVSISMLFLSIMGLSVLVLSTTLLISGEWPPWDARAWLASAASGLLNLLALFFLYRALARGPVAIASPAASTFTVLLVGLNIFSGESWSWLQLLAMLTVFLAVGMLARPSHVDLEKHHYTAKWLRQTAYFGLAAAASVALRMYLAQEAGAAIGAAHALYLNRVFAFAGAIMLVIYIFLRQQNFRKPTGKLWLLVSLQALFETTALGAFLIGSADGGRVAVTIGFSAFAAATVLMARLWLKEKIGWQRSLWILIIAIGVMLAMLANP